MNLRRWIAATLVAGVALGAAVALRYRGAPSPAFAAPVAGADPPPVQRIPISPRGPVAIAARADDPGGGTPWAVRRFTTRTDGHTYPCSQLGRLDGKRFGWISPGRPFRAARFDQADVSTMCGERFFQGRPQLTQVTLTTDGATGLPRPDRTVVWGVLPPGIASARLSDGTRLRPGAGGVVLAVLPGQPVGTLRLSGTLRTSSGTLRTFPDPAAGQRRALSTARRRPVDAAPLSDRTRVAALAADPAGGAAWGILTAPGTRGATCFSEPSHIVGDRAALVDPRLGLAMVSPLFFGLDCSDRRAPTATQPLRMDVLVSSIPDEDPTGARQLRRLNDRTVLHGRTTADVTAVTITTSRDIRTVVPDPRTHVVLAVYDGTFPAERVKFTATLRNGRHVTVLQSSGG